MKKYFIIAFLILIVSGAFAQLGGSYSKTQSDAKYYKVADGVLGYTADQVSAKTQKPYEKLIFAHGNKIVFPVFTAALWNTSYTLVNGSSVGTYYMVEDTVIADAVQFYTTVDANYTPFVDTTTYFNGFALYESNVSTKVLTKLTQTKNTPQMWDAGTAAGTLVTTSLNAETTLYPNKVYWIEGYWTTNTSVTVPTFLHFGAFPTRNVYGYFFAGIDDSNNYPAASKTNPTAYAGLSSIPGFTILYK
jgi:hypothetical protein